MAPAARRASTSGPLRPSARVTAIRTPVRGATLTKSTACVVSRDLAFACDPAPQQHDVHAAYRERDAVRGDEPCCPRRWDRTVPDRRRARVRAIHPRLPPAHQTVARGPSRPAQEHLREDAQRRIRRQRRKQTQEQRRERRASRRASANCSTGGGCWRCMSAYTFEDGAAAPARAPALRLAPRLNSAP